MVPDRIDYGILDDGTCSYCGRDVGMFELPDGTMDWNTQCHACEAYNEEELVEAFAAYYETVNISGLDFEV